MAPQRSAPQQKRSEEKVTRILDAADAIFAKHGISGSNTKLIAQEAGVAVGTIYRYYPDKHALASALTQRYLDDVLVEYAKIADKVTALDKAAPALCELIDVTFEARLRHRGYFAIAKELDPSDTESPGYAARQAMIEEFDRRLRDLGSPLDSESQRQMIEFGLEAVRHFLGRVPDKVADQPAYLDELKALTTAHLNHRIFGDQPRG